MTQPPNLTATKNICKCGHDIMAHTYMDIKPECVDCVCNMFEPQQPPLTAEEYTLMLCDRCNQMTNHVCHKCNKFIPLSLITDRIKKVEEEFNKEVKKWRAIGITEFDLKDKLSYSDKMWELDIILSELKTLAGVK